MSGNPTYQELARRHSRRQLRVVTCRDPLLDEKSVQVQAFTSAALCGVRLLGKRAGHDGPGEHGLPGLLAMGTFRFARSGTTGAGMGVHGDRVLLVAVRARQINQDVEWG